MPHKNWHHQWLHSFLFPPICVFSSNLFVVLLTRLAHWKIWSFVSIILLHTEQFECGCAGGTHEKSLSFVCNHPKILLLTENLWPGGMLSQAFWCAFQSIKPIFSPNSYFSKYTYISGTWAAKYIAPFIFLKMSLHPIVRTTPTSSGNIPFSLCLPLNIYCPLVASLSPAIFTKAYTLGFLAFLIASANVNNGSIFINFAGSSWWLYTWSYVTNILWLCANSVSSFVVQHFRS